MRCATKVCVVYPKERGSIGLRGDAPLSWEETRAPTKQEGDRSWFEFEVTEHALVELKLVRGDGDWQEGRNYVVHARDQLDIEPHFDRSDPELLSPNTLGEGESAIRYQVLLPPSYGEQTSKRYPVLFVVDGQSLWSTSEDPYGVWNLDATIASLFELHAMDEALVGSIETSERRVERLSPIKDASGEGGRGQELLDAIVSALVPRIDRDFRTKATREHRGVMGSSLGGLFAFFAAWTRPDISEKLRVYRAHSGGPIAGW